MCIAKMCIAVYIQLSMEAVLIRSVTGRCKRDRTPVSLHRPGINYKYTRISMYKPHSLSSLVIQGEGIKRVSLLNLFYQKKPRYFETITRNTQDSWTGFTCFSKPCFLYIASTCSCEIFEMNCMCYEDMSPITYDWDVRTIRQSKEKCCFFKQWLLVCYLMYQFSLKDKCTSF